MSEEGGQPESATKSQHALLLMKTLIIVGCGSDLSANIVPITDILKNKPNKSVDKV